jgi:hypothetical protein
MNFSFYESDSPGPLPCVFLLGQTKFEVPLCQRSDHLVRRIGRVSFSSTNVNRMRLESSALAVPETVS